MALGVTAVLGVFTHRRKEAVTERAYALGHAGWLITVGGCAALTIGADSFLLPLMCVMALAFFGRLRPDVATAYSWAAFLLGCVPVLATDWDGFR